MQINPFPTGMHREDVKCIVTGPPIMTLQKERMDRLESLEEKFIRMIDKLENIEKKLIDRLDVNEDKLEILIHRLDNPILS